MYLLFLRMALVIFFGELAISLLTRIYTFAFSFCKYRFVRKIPKNKVLQKLQSVHGSVVHVT